MKSIAGYHWIMIGLCDGLVYHVQMYKTLKGAEKQKPEWEYDERCKAVILSAEDILEWHDRGIGELKRLLKL